MLIHKFHLAVIVTDVNGCEGTSSVLITQLPSPSTPVISSLSGSTTFCKSDSINLDAGVYSDDFLSNIYGVTEILHNKLQLTLPVVILSG